MTDLIPPPDRILCRPHSPDEQTAFGLVLPEQAQQASMRATVIAVGSGPVDRNGTQHPIPLAVGDEIVLPAHGGSEIEYEDGTVISILAESVLCRVG